jgi:hypothetical protein
LLPSFDYRRGEPKVLDLDPRFRADETANTASEDKRATGTAEGWLLIRLAKKSAPHSSLAATRRTCTGIKDGSGDRYIKSARPYEKSHEHRLIYDPSPRMNKDWQFPAIKRIDNFAEQLCGGQNDVAFGRNPFGASRFASGLRTAHHHDAHRIVRTEFVRVPRHLAPCGAWTKCQ